MSLVVLASGNGSNLAAILDAGLPVTAVVSNKKGAFALTRAKAAGIPAVVVPVAGGKDRRAYDAKLATAVAEFQPEWVVLAGWMRLLTSTFLDHFPNRVVNLHPALPGELPGLHAIERAHHEFLSRMRRHTGVMVHLVPDEAVDAGPVLATMDVPINPGDTLEVLAARVHAAEHVLLVDTLRTLLAKPAGTAVIASATTPLTTPPTTPPTTPRTT
jgi:phosphoribosylglycinamide formyltransferase 1